MKSVAAPFLALGLMGLASTTMSQKMYAAIFEVNSDNLVDRSFKGVGEGDDNTATTPTITWDIPEHIADNLQGFKGKCAVGGVVPVRPTQSTVTSGLNKNPWADIGKEISEIFKGPGTIEDKIKKKKELIQKKKKKVVEDYKKELKKAKVRYKFFFTSDKNKWKGCKKEDIWNLFAKETKDAKDMSLQYEGEVKGEVAQSCFKKDGAEDSPVCGTSDEKGCAACNFNSSLIPSTMAAAAMVIAAGLFFI